jgi:hypothetical protein
MFIETYLHWLAHLRKLIRTFPDRPSNMTALGFPAAMCRAIVAKKWKQF